MKKKILQLVAVLTCLLSVNILLILFVQLYNIHVVYCFGLKLQLVHALGCCEIHVLLNL